MKKYGIWIAVAVVVLAVVCACLFYFLQPSDDGGAWYVGKWKGTYEYNGFTFDVSFELKKDGTYYRVAYKDGVLNSEQTGTYEVAENMVITYKDGAMDTVIEYTFENGRLENNGHEFFKKK